MSQSLSLPLSGRTILDCSSRLPGPFLGMLLANLGAEVIKIENPHRADEFNSNDYFKSWYQALNSKKQLLKIDLSSSQGQAEFSELVKKADGLIEAFKPKLRQKLGLSSSQLHPIHPKLCIVSLIGYPEQGSQADRAGHDLNFQAVTGCLSLFGSMPGLPLAGLFAAYSGALKFVAALDATARGKPGTRISVNLVDTLKEVQTPYIKKYLDTQKPPQHGNTLTTGRFPCYRTYETRDGRQIAVAATEQKFWQRLCEILDLPELKEKAYDEGQAGEQVMKLMQQAFLSQSFAYWRARFSEEDCCVEPVLNYSEVYSHGV